MQEKRHVIEILRKAKKAIKEEDVVQLKELSNKTVHTASIYQDPDNIAVAIVLYVLSKAIERTGYREYPQWKQFERKYEQAIDKAIEDLEKDNVEHYRIHINEVREAVKKLSGNFRKHMEDVFRKAQINKASRLYEHGISQEKTAKILGITQWELQQYAGQTRIADVNLAYTRDLDDRIKLAQNMFAK